MPSGWEGVLLHERGWVGLQRVNDGKGHVAMEMRWKGMRTVEWVAIE